MLGKFAAVPISLFGHGSRKELVPLLKREQVKRALVVTDRVLDELGIVKLITDVLEEASVTYVVFNEVTPNPTVENVERGCKVYDANTCDCIVAIGGGSANDCAKAIQVVVTNGGSIHDYEGGNKSPKRGGLLVAVNTTAGTASEASRAYLISDEQQMRKMIFKDDYTMPNIAVNDTELMMNLPKSITAQTGMDALTHAVEASIAKNRFLLTDLLAMQAAELIYKYLPKVVEEPTNEEARDAMAHGQYLAGLSFGSSGLGLVHAMAHQLGVVYHLPHGLCNAILLPTVMTFFKEVCVKEFAQLADRLLLEKVRGQSEEEKTTVLIQHIQLLSEQVGTDVRLHTLGVEAKDLEMLAEKTLMDGCIFAAPVMPTKQQVITLFESLL